VYSENMISTLNDIAHKYRPIIHQAIHSVVSQPPYKNTGAGAASLTVEVIDGNASKAPDIAIHFDEHLLFLDKRKMQWTKLPDVKKLMEWAATKKSTESEVKQLAWAVAWNQKKQDTWKAKPWRKKTLSAVLKEMNKLVLEEFDKAIQADFDLATKKK
jgi:hypothetical protein